MKVAGKIYQPAPSCTTSWSHRLQIGGNDDPVSHACLCINDGNLGAGHAGAKTCRSRRLGDTSGPGMRRRNATRQRCMCKQSRCSTDPPRRPPHCPQMRKMECRNLPSLLLILKSTLAASPIGWASLIESAKVQQIGSLNEPLARWQMPASHRDRSPIALPKSWTFETGVDHGNPGCIDGAWE